MINPDNIFVVLSEPKGPGNVGSVARAMNNMGLKELVLVKPCDYQSHEARKMASGCNETLLNAVLFESVREAVADAGFVVGMTCRTGKYRRNIVDVDGLTEKLASVSDKNRVALLFGTERTGLANDEIALCDLLVSIPTSSLNRSLNLSQAVLLVCYEIFKKSKERLDNREKEPVDLATSEELEMMYDHMEDVFREIGYTNPQNPGHIMMTIRGIFARADLDSRDVRILRGMVGKMDCYRKWVERGKTKRTKLGL